MLYIILIQTQINTLEQITILKYLKDGRFQVICKKKGIIQVSYFLPNTNYIFFNDKISTIPVIENPDKMAIYICNQLKNVAYSIDTNKITKKIEEEPKGKKYKIVIDPGHGGKFIGTSGSLLLEKDLNLDISLRLYALLKSKYDVVLTRNSDRELKDSLTDDLNERVNISHKIWADLFISLHHNFAYNSSIRGLEIYLPTYANWSDKANKINAISATLSNNGYKNARHYYDYLKISTNTIAGLIAKKIYNVLPFNGIKSKDLRVLRENLVPAILVEIEYLSNPDAENFLLSAYNRQKIAQLLYESIDEYFIEKSKKILK